MATTKKTITKKTTKKPVKRSDVVAARDRIYKLRDSIYKKMNGRWSNSYGKDQFQSAIRLLNQAADELNNMY